MIEQLPERVDKFKAVKEHKYAIVGGVVLFFIILFFVLLISGTQDCEIVSLKEGVLQNCDCSGLDITVKSISNSGERKTVCMGIIRNKVKYTQ